MNEPLPNTLCKFVTVEGLINVLETGKLKFSAAPLFNDPFDMTSNPFDYDVKDFTEALERELKKIFSDKEKLKDLLIKSGVPLDSPDLKKARLGDTFKVTCDQIIKESEHSKTDYKNRIKAFSGSRRILCLTTNHDNLLMWAHYTNNHKGAVLAFSGNNNFFNGTNKVIYQKEFPTRTFVQNLCEVVLGQDNILKMVECLITKSDDWIYEHEWKLMREAENPALKREFHPFPPEALTTIYLGCKTKEDNVREVLSLIKGDFKHVKVLKASRNSKEFKLDFDPI